MVLLIEIIPHARQKIGLLYTANIMAADKLATQGARKLVQYQDANLPV